jgi:5-methylcytosine-specific restriction protein A
VSKKPVRFCCAFGCTRTHRNKAKYCNEHNKLKHGFKKELRPDHHLYNNASWRNYSKRIRQSSIVCVNFRECAGMAQVVDHIKPISLGGDFWDANNHQCLCHSCHNRKSQKERIKTSI